MSQRHVYWPEKILVILTENQWGLVTLLYWGKGAVFCAWLTVIVVIFSHHFLLILEITSEIRGSLRPAAGGSSWNGTSETKNALPVPKLYCKRQCDIGMHSRCYEYRGNKGTMEDSNQCESGSCSALYCERESLITLRARVPWQTGGRAEASMMPARRLPRARPVKAPDLGANK